MRWLCGCAHQLPLMAAPMIASLSRGAGPFAEARTTPCSRTKSSAWSAVVMRRMAVYSVPTRRELHVRGEELHPTNPVFDLPVEPAALAVEAVSSEGGVYIRSE